MLKLKTLDNYSTILQHTQALTDECSEATLEQIGQHPRVVLTSNPCPCYLETLKDLNPCGVLGTWDNNLQQAISQLLAGRAYYSPMQYESPLTGKEREVLHLNARGLEVKDIAKQLHGCPSTINTHLKRIYEKLRLAFPHLKLENSRHLLLYWRGEWHLIQKNPQKSILKIGDAPLEKSV